MKVTAFLIKYGEIAIKGKNRYMFEDALMKQIRHAMAPVGDFKVRKESGRMFVEAQDEFDYDEAVEALQRVFGIVGICPMVIEENKDMEHLTETVIKFIDEQYPVKDFTFKVHAPKLFCLIFTCNFYMTTTNRALVRHSKQFVTVSGQILCDLRNDHVCFIYRNRISY